LGRLGLGGKPFQLSVVALHLHSRMSCRSCVCQRDSAGCLMWDQVASPCSFASSPGPCFDVHVGSALLLRPHMAAGSAAYAEPKGAPSAHAPLT
jgi:hypothetical protein